MQYFTVIAEFVFSRCYNRRPSSSVCTSGPPSGYFVSYFHRLTNELKLKDASILMSFISFFANIPRVLTASVLTATTPTHSLIRKPQMPFRSEFKE